MMRDNFFGSCGICQCRGVVGFIVSRPTISEVCCGEAQPHPARPSDPWRAPCTPAGGKSKWSVLTDSLVVTRTLLHFLGRRTNHFWSFTVGF